MFDARAARALQAGQHIVIDGAPGLRLEASASTRSWTFRYRSPVDGRMRQVRIGHWPAMTLPAALASWERLKAERDAGRDPGLEKRQKRQVTAAQAAAEAYTVRRACADYLKAYAGSVTPKTYAEADRMLNGPEVKRIAEREAASITRADAFDTIEALAQSPVQAGRLRQLLGAVWDRGLDSGRLPADCPNWWRLVLRGKLPSKGKLIGGERRGVQKRVLSEPELRALLPWMPNFSRDVEDALTLVLWTACRGAEVVAMRVDEISEEEGGTWWWTIPRERLKMRRNPLLTDLRVPLVGRAAAIVRRRLPGVRNGWAFPSVGRSGHIEQKALGVAVWTHMPGCESRPEWERQRLPVAGWAPHDLRRTGRTLLAALGCPGEIAEAILGHMLPGIQAVYNRHAYDAERLDWLTRLAARLEVLAAPA
jgi:integrase